jgi:hypothetical protein
MRKVAACHLYGLVIPLVLVARTLSAQTSAEPTPAAQTPVTQSPNVQTQSVQTQSVQTLSAQSLAPPHPALPAGQVWQCIRDGQRVFSDTRCGEGATIRQLNDTNRMDTAPAWRGGFRSPGQGAYPAYDSPYADERGPEEPVDPVYGTQAVTVVSRTQHVPHTFRTHLHDPGRPSVTRAGHAAVH